MTDSPAKSPRRAPSAIFRVAQGVVMLIAGFLLVSHMIKWAPIQVDGITLALIGILCITPLAELVTKIKLGDFEAEIGRDEVAKAQAKAASEFSPSVDDAPRTLEDRIRTLLRDDPPLAFAKVRIELEDALNRLFAASGGDQAQSRRLSLGRLVDTMVRQKALTQPMADALRSVITLANRAIHGEYAEPETAERLALLGARLTEEIQQLTQDRVLAPAKRDVITHEERGWYSEARYRVTTIVPLVDNPTRNTYLMDQDGLDAFLEGYETYAEFLIGIEPLLPPQSAERTVAADGAAQCSSPES